MFVLELIAEALRNLRRHKLRSLLTTLGIVFGVASVLSMVAVGEGARRSILERIQELGTRNIIINSHKPPEEEHAQDEAETSRTLEYGLSFRDAAQIEATLPMVEQVLAVHDVEEWIWFGSRRMAAKVRGVTPAYFHRLRLRPYVGRILTVLDDEDQRRVCVIRASLLREAKYVGDPMQLDLKIGTTYFHVVGVLPDVEFQSPNRVVLGIDSQAHEVYVPFGTVVGRFGLSSRVRRAGSWESTRVELHQIVVSIRREQDVLSAARGIATILGTFHKKADYEITVPLELLESQRRTQRVFNIVLPVIAGISLLVGGIGIMNIMLASITERTREIGVRRAIGASARDITTQFLIETVTLSAAGGLLGMLLGLIGVSVLESATSWTAAVTPWSLALSMGISCLTGVVFGIYPARRAAAMDPIQALRQS